MSGVSGVEENLQGREQDLENTILSGEFRWMSRAQQTDPEEEICSVAESCVDDSRNSGIDTYSDGNSSTGLELSELAIHTLLVETRARDLVREDYQDPDSDRYMAPSETILDKTADDLGTVAVSEQSMNLLPQKEVVRTGFQPFRQMTEALAKI